jgi:GDP/UDP-N,N'-diacetylbacillosamine 2-epimerase (hydrolysing)
MKRKICVVTGSRAEYGNLYETLKLIAGSDDLALQLVVTGMHLSPAFGHTVDEIKADGFEIADRIEMMLASDTPAAIGKSVGLGIIGLVDSYRRLKPDLVLLTGDRFEMFAAASAAMLTGLPIAHISGGEVSEGAVDEQIRHAITKMSHLHLVLIEENASRVRQMGEEPWRVRIVGGPWIDNLRRLETIGREELKALLGIRLAEPAVLVTYHPVTLEPGKAEGHIRNLFAALAQIKGEIIFTYPNADAGGAKIIRAIEEFCAGRPNAKAFKSLGRKLYLNLLARVDLMVGNSSSAIVESLAFRLPAVNIGNRQSGRFATGNIISVPADRDEISRAVRKALEPAFRRRIKGMKNPYDRGCTAGNIVEVLRTVKLGPDLLCKKFINKP